jgi:dipeptidyl aminopeptidase/acylaminoacyl peptidase
MTIEELRARAPASKMFTTQSFDGVPLEGYYIPPSTSALGTPPPVIVWAHGGPNSSVFARNVWDRRAAILLQQYADAGFATLAVDYRGSTQHGDAFSRMNDGDWGDEDVKDLRSAVEAFAEQGLVDVNRAAVMGESHGGYMSLMALANEGSFFKAAVDINGMTDLSLNWSLSRGEPPLYRSERMPTPLEDGTFLAERSGLTHVDKFESPLLVLHGRQDTNVFSIQSDVLARTMRDRFRGEGEVVQHHWDGGSFPEQIPLGSKLTYLTFPDGHGLFNHEDVYPRYVVQFLKEHLGAPRP